MSLDERDNNLTRSDVKIDDQVVSIQQEMSTIIKCNEDVSSESTEDDDDESVEKKKMTVTNLKTTFEHLSLVQSEATDKPNWWIRQNSQGEYIIYNSTAKPSGKKAYRKLSNPEKFLAKLNSEQIREIIDGEDDKIRKIRRNTASNRSNNNNNGDCIENNNETGDKISTRYVWL